MIEEIRREAEESYGWTGRTSVDERVLNAMSLVPREEFLPGNERAHAYVNSAASIGCGQTISQPYIVALMTDLADLAPGDSVLEIGTGSGYQAAVLAELVRQVRTIEILPELVEIAKEALDRLGYGERVEVRQGDGREGWPENAPYDAIIVAAAADEIPQRLVEQLAPGGRLVIPVGSFHEVQTLVRLEKREDGEIEIQSVLPVRFVPLVHAH